MKPSDVTEETFRVRLLRVPAGKARFHFKKGDVVDAVRPGGIFYGTVFLVAPDGDRWDVSPRFWERVTR